jgi:hypothetical protein
MKSTIFPSRSPTTVSAVWRETGVDLFFLLVIIVSREPPASPAGAHTGLPCLRINVPRRGEP